MCERGVLAQHQVIEVKQDILALSETHLSNNDAKRLFRVSIEHNYTLHEISIKIWVDEIDLKSIHKVSDSNKVNLLASGDVVETEQCPLWLREVLTVCVVIVNH